MSVPSWTKWVVLFALCFGSPTFALAQNPGQNSGDLGNAQEIGPEPDYAKGPTDYTRREVMVRMRDGKRLFTIILQPKVVRTALPIILTRTPYGASSSLIDTEHGTTKLSSIVPDGEGALAQSGYIFVLQDIRGRGESEGNFTVNRPIRGPLNRTATDESTDIYDSIDWLVKNVPNNNGRVGITGTSYDGWEALMALVHPHPALKASVPVNPMVDAWFDDSFHNGAVRLANADWVYEMTMGKKNHVPMPWGAYDTYSANLPLGSASEFGQHYQLDKSPFWQRLMSHPAYDDHWRRQAVDDWFRELGGTTIPTLVVHSLFDQEDIYGAPRVYKALEEHDKANDKIFLVAGPWNHGGSKRESASLGKVRWGSSTGLAFQTGLYLSFFDKYLKDKAPSSPIAPVTFFDTGTHNWKEANSWQGTTAALVTPIYLKASGTLSFAPSSESDSMTGYVADPAKPTPYRIRPILPIYANGSTWSDWLMDDQRPFSDRPDVLTFMSPPLEIPLTIQGAAKAQLFVQTDATDADFVVKLIDVFPEEHPTQPEMGGYQMMVAGDIMRGRYRKANDKPEQFVRGETAEVQITLPEASHTFLPGHRIMVQVQSYWFPLYDRNPQTFVDNPSFAKPSDYRSARHSIYHDQKRPSRIDLPVVK